MPDQQDNQVIDKILEVYRRSPTLIDAWSSEELARLTNSDWLTVVEALNDNEELFIRVFVNGIGRYILIEQAGLSE